MLHSWLHQRGARDCLLFFAGFGMDPKPFRAIPCREHDLLMCWDWREPGPWTPTLPAGYRRVYLVAWSMGVPVAAHILGPVMRELAGAAAVNGTLHPIDDRCGIAPQRYQETLTALNEPTLSDFYRSMFDDGHAAAAFLAHRPRRGIVELRDELAALWRLSLEEAPPADHFTTVVVGQRDRVIPARNQLRAWGRARCRLYPLPHFFFHLGTELSPAADITCGWPSWDALARDLFGGGDHGPG